MSGVKNDKDKPRPELIPPSALEAMARVYAHGAAKYGDWNWRKGLEWSRLLGAVMRHLLAWSRGEATDKETGESHLTHALCTLAMLSASESEGLGTDDRP